MPDYYFDIETNPRMPKPDYKNDEILTIQFQRLDSRTGEKEGDLTIFKSWESSERDILERFYSIFNPEELWVFVPIGFNLSFDFFSLLIGLNRVYFASFEFIPVHHATSKASLFISLYKPQSSKTWKHTALCAFNSLPFSSLIL